jgi:hypothetical protein
MICESGCDIAEYVFNRLESYCQAIHGHRDLFYLRNIHSSKSAADNIARDSIGDVRFGADEADSCRCSDSVPRFGQGCHTQLQFLVLSSGQSLINLVYVNR